ncbi:MAG TPA: hypothetical protein VFH45_07000, partial [Acidimicrobiales bacterium]|nr:hypothetical protein [Acidimicrobiales bacterium]
PVERVDAAAFAAKTAADRLHACMQERGLVCAQVAIEAESEHGERLSRRWRHDGGLTASSLADRVRWQLEGWLTGPNPPTAGLVLIRLEPDGLAPARGLQPGFWGGAAESDDQAARGLARVQALLGPDAVLVTVPDGGRSAGDQVRLVPWGDDRVPARPTVCPWPGRVPGAAPVVVPAHPEPVELLDGDGRPVQVSGRGLISAAPRLLRTAGGDGVVTGWSAPWPCHERWWAPSGRRRVARLQVLTADGRALLLAVDRGRWAVEGVY